METRRLVSKGNVERRTGRGVEKRRAVIKDKVERRTGKGGRKGEQ